MSNMLTNKSWYLTAALVLPVMALLVVGGSTLVQARPQGPHQGSLHGGAMLERISERLELTPTQQEQIEELLAENHEQLKPQWQAVKAARDSLFEKIHAEVFNEGAIRQAAGDIAAVEEDLAVSRALLFQEILQILTPEQQVKLEETIETMRAFMGDRFARHRKHRGPISE